MIRVVSDAADAPANPPHEAHGRAALLLVESLIHGLMSRAVLTIAEAIDIIDIAADVENEFRASSAGGDGTPPPSVLAPLATSLRFELGANPAE